MFKLLNLRRITQGLFLVLFLFLFLQTESKGEDVLGYPVRLFLDFDPLILITTLLSAHAASVAFYWSLIVIAVTAVLGRVFCGWVCPLGTLNNILGSFNKHAGRRLGAGWHRVKYLVLVFLLSASAFTLQPVGLVDPISLLIRSMSISVMPLADYAARASMDAAYVLGASDAAESMYSFLRTSVLSFEQPHFRQGLFIGLIFALVLGLNLVERRFWCRYLCPLGALLGLLSRYALLKRTVSEGCTDCGECYTGCQGGALEDAEKWKISECLYCMSCDDVCPAGVVRFGFGMKKVEQGLDIGRRRIVVSALSGAVVVPLVRTVPVLKPGAQPPELIRPPGALDEVGFLRRCVKCGECMKVCITNGLQPTLLEAGIEGIWSPVLVPRIGYCEYRCTLCGQVCPTGAIKKIRPEQKGEIKIGLAMIDKNRCLPYAHATPCIVCEEVCPLPRKAIWFEDAKAVKRDGTELKIKQPRVDLELCNGCGICETKCPVGGRAAIYVTSIGETRSTDNRLLL
jgi:polyferredoxin